MKDGKLSKKIGLILLGLLTLVFRFPITESPTGSDNFFYISELNSLLNQEEIFWAEN